MTCVLVGQNRKDTPSASREVCFTNWAVQHHETFHAVRLPYFIHGTGELQPRCLSPKSPCTVRCVSREQPALGRDRAPQSTPEKQPPTWPHCGSRMYTDKPVHVDAFAIPSLKNVPILFCRHVPEGLKSGPVETCHCRPPTVRSFAQDLLEHDVLLVSAQLLGTAPTTSAVNHSRNQSSRRGRTRHARPCLIQRHHYD